jgi:cation/acetate symporter
MPPRQAALTGAAADADKAPLKLRCRSRRAARDAVLPKRMLGGRSRWPSAASWVGNELTTVDNDIMVLANPEIAHCRAG